jgi:plasmid stability protein
VPDLLVRDIEDDLKQLIEDSARAHRRSLSEEVKSLVRVGLDAAVRASSAGSVGEAKAPVDMGTYLYSLLPEEYRGDDLVFEIKGDISPPRDFE